MGTPRFCPRDYEELLLRGDKSRSAFGRPGKRVKWQYADGDEGFGDLDSDVRQRAAQIQDAYCKRIAARMRALDCSAAQYAEAAGMSYDRLMKVLRGDALLRLEDIATAELLLGRITVPAPELPPLHSSHELDTAY